MLIDEFNIESTVLKNANKIILPKKYADISNDEIGRFNRESVLNSYAYNIENIYNQNFNLIKCIVNAYEDVSINFQLSNEINLLFYWDIVKGNAEVNNSDSFISGNIKAVFNVQKKEQIKLKKNTSVMFCVLTLEHLSFLKVFKEDYYIQYFSLFKSVYSNTYYEMDKNNSLKLTIPIKNIIEKCFHNPFVDKLEAYYISSKIHGLISLIHEIQIEKKVEGLNEETIKKLNQARIILTDDLVDPPTIKELSKLIALNELKLKQGFKELFGTTIHNYTIKLRMEKAQSLMNESNMLIFEVAIMLGYKDTSHFINVFKKYFGYTPKYFCTKIKLQ